MKTKQKVGILFLLLCMSLLALTLCASAVTYSGKCGDNLTYTLDTDTGVLIISGTGEMWGPLCYHDSKEHRRIDIYGLVRAVKFSGEVTSIGEEAFYGCSGLKRITIPDSVTSIGKSAFSSCSSLTSINIPDSVTSIGNSAFSYCRSLTSVSIPDSVTSIGDSAFSSCSSLTSVSIPDSVTSIGEEAFYGCSSLTSITIPFVGASRDAEQAYEQVFGYIFGYTKSSNASDFNLKDATNQGKFGGSYYYYYIPAVLREVIVTDAILIPASAFHNCGRLTSISIPDSVTSIGESAFHNCGSLTSISIPDSVTSIGNSAFRGCSDLTSISIPDSVTSIGESAFHNCGSLTSISIPDSVTSIGNSAFRGCSDLTSINIPDSVTSIGYAAFYGCKSLTSISIPSGVTSIGGSAFSGCSSLTSISIPSGVTSIGGSAFRDCSSLRSITIPDSVTSIGDDAFIGTAWFLNKPEGVVYAGRIAYTCKGNVSSVSLEEGTTRIEADAFRGCSSLRSITISDSVTSIGESAFSGCSSLTSVSIGNGVTSIGMWAFYGCSRLNAVYITDTAAWCRIAFSSSDANPLSYAHNLYLNGELVTDLVIPDSVTSIGKSAFSGCRNLASITIPSGVTSIGDSAFSYCSSLTSISIPSGVTSIGGWAFSDCSRLTSISIPDSVTSIGASAFSGCSNLTSISIPDSVKSIGNYAFRDCSSLTSITILNPNCWIGDRQEVMPSAATIYGYADSTAAAYAKKYGLTFLSIGGKCGEKLTFRMNLDTGVLSITGTGTMDNWYMDDQPWYTSHSYIRSVRIASGATNVGDFAFDCCENLVDAVIAETVESIGNGAFDNCEQLEQVTILNQNCKILNSSMAFPATAVIYGYDDSTAEAYATKYNRRFVSLGHAHIYADGFTVDVPVSCTVDGKKSRHCTVEGCTATIDDTVIPAPGHKFGEWQVRTPAKCEETGVDYRICSVCQNEETRTTNALGHAYSTTWTVDTPAKCATPGSKSHHCTRCDAITDVTEIPATGAHKFADTFTIDVPATCTAVGSKSRHCTVCDAKTDITEIPKTAHAYSTTWTIDTPAACTTPGEKSHHCKNCDEKTDITVIPATGHKPAADWTIDVAAGCVTDGSKSHHCTVCDEKLDVTVIPAVGVHKDADGDGKCDDCGKLFGEGWALDDATGELTVTGSGTVTDTNWKTVADKVKVIKIDSGITSLPDDAFAGCTDITIRCEAGSYAADYARDHGYKTSFINSTETADGTVVAKGLADGAIPEGTTLTATPVDKSEIPASVLEKLGKEPEFDVADIVMEKDGEAMQPNGKIAVTVRVDAEKRYKAYRVNADGTLTVMSAAVDGDKLTFEADTTGRYLVQVRKFIPGVVTGEGEKPMKKDLLRLQKYLAGWDVEIDEAAADCNGDEQISKADLLRLQKYLAGWDVKLGE